MALSYPGSQRVLSSRSPNLKNLWAWVALSLKAKRNCIVDNFGIIGFLFFGRIPVDSSYFSLHFDSILSPKAPKKIILNVLKRSLILAYGQTGS
jgi:hypothetical protein